MILEPDNSPPHVRWSDRNCRSSTSYTIFGSFWFFSRNTSIKIWLSSKIQVNERIEKDNLRKLKFFITWGNPLNLIFFDIDQLFRDSGKNTFPCFMLMVLFLYRRQEPHIVVMSTVSWYCPRRHQQSIFSPSLLEVRQFFWFYSHEPVLLTNKLLCCPFHSALSPMP